MPEVEFKVLKDFPRYRFGSDGSVWVPCRRRGAMQGEWVKMRLFPEPPYLRVQVSGPLRARRSFRVHALIARAFLGERPRGLVVRHLNGNGCDNRAANLAYGTQLENVSDAKRHGSTGRTVGVRNASTKLTESQVLEIRSLYASGVSRPDLKRRYRVGKSTIEAILVRRTWRYLPNLQLVNA